MFLNALDDVSIIDDPSSEFHSDIVEKKPLNDQMESVEIPRFLQESYVNGTPPIKCLRQWQYDLFSRKEWKNKENCIILVPTAGGKTVAAEVAIAQLLDHDAEAKVIYCLPFVSLASEKFLDFAKKFKGFSVYPFYSNLGGSEFKRGNIAVCTFEKAHNLINSAIRNQYIDKIKLIIIDEIHMIGDQKRGPTIEAIITKIKLLQNHPRIIGLSATIDGNDAINLGKWLNGFVHQSSTRPSCITQFVKSPTGGLHKLQNGIIGDELFQLKSLPGDKYHILPLVADTIKKNPKNTILIFVNSRKETRVISNLISTYLFSPEFGKISSVIRPSSEVIEERKKLVQKISSIQSYNDEIMCKCIMNGVGFHNAGLLLEERKIIEDGLRNDVLNVIVATTTLSAGININSVSTVIIFDVFRHELGKKIPLTTVQYNQMAGRAGRTTDNPGKTIIIQHNDEKEEIDLISQLSKQKIGKLYPHLLDKSEFDRYYLQCICYYQNNKHNFAMNTFEYFNKKMNFDEIEEKRKESIQRLINLRLILDENKATKLGFAVAGANFGIDEGLNVYENLKKAQLLTCFSDELHLMYLCIPTDIGFTTPPYSKEIWSNLFFEHSYVMNKIFQMTNGEFNRIIALSHVQGGIKTNKELDFSLDHIYASAIILDIIDEKPINEIEKKFQIDRGIIQALQTNISTFAGQVTKFCELCGFYLLGSAINRFRNRLENGVKNELLNLMQIPSCTKSIARLLFNKGIEDINQLLESSLDEIESIISNSGSSVPDELNETENEKIIAEKLKSEAYIIAENKQRIEDFENSLIEMKYEK